MTSADDRAARLRSDLMGAVDRGEFVAVFQPQFSLDDDRIVSAEALARWLHPEFGPIAPAEFVPVAERDEIISDIGYQMVHLGCRAAAKWAESGHPIDVAINVSLLQLRDAGFAAHVQDCIDQTGVDPHLVIFELTESTALADVPHAIESARAITALGISISIDDFGSGFWSEEQVVQLPAAELKLDQKLVQGDGAEAGADLKEAIAFGRERGMRLVAEGVETPEQLARVRALGCHRAQGFLLARPMSDEDLDERLRAS